MFATRGLKPRTIPRSGATQARTVTSFSKDADFRQRSFLLGPPPKVVWVRLGNCSADDILELLSEHEPDIRILEADPTPLSSRSPNSIHTPGSQVHNNLPDDELHHHPG